MEYDSEIDGLIMRKKLLNIIAKTFRIVAFLLIVFFIINRLTPFYSHMENEDYNYIAFNEGVNYEHNYSLRPFSFMFKVRFSLGA